MGQVDSVIPVELESVLVSTTDTLGGSIRFAGTRVPVQAIIDTLDDGDGIEEFLAGWPDVSRSQAEAFIDSLATSSTRAPNLFASST